MYTARQVPVRAFVAALVLIVPLLTAGSASGAIVINEVETNGAVAPQIPEFVELYNTGGAPVDISSYAIDDSSANPALGTQVPGGTTIAAGGFYVMTDPPGLGDADAVHLYDAGDVEIDSHTWAVAPSATYGRCPDGTGAFTGTSSTPGAANACPIAAGVWPGGATISTVDGVGVLGGNMSGLAYQPSGTSAPGVLWAVKNDPGTLFRLIWNGTIWTPDTADNWGAGKTLRYPGGAGNPDAEGVTLAGGDPNGIYVATERDGNGVSRPAILRFDTAAAGATLTATDDFNLTPNLPNLNDNGGLEAITWVPDSFLVSKGFKDEATAAAYNPAIYANHGAGVFFVGVENLGHIVGYAVDSVTDGFTRVATIQSPPNVMDLQFEAETNLMWAACDNDCGGRYTRFDVGPLGNFVVKDAFQRPAGMPNLNNEGFAIAPQAECVNGLKPAIWADDSNTGGNVLRQGTLNCTNPPASDSDGDGVVDATDNCPAVANPGQENADADTLGDACDADDDNDGVPDASDACPTVAAGTDANGDGCTDAGSGGGGVADADGDGVPDASDNCPTTANANQADADGDKIGDACDPIDDVACAKAKAKLKKAKKALKKAKKSGDPVKIKRAKKRVKKAKKAVRAAC